jgi:hypothetical protein
MLESSPSNKPPLQLNSKITPQLFRVDGSSYSYGEFPTAAEVSRTIQELSAVIPCSGLTRELWSELRLANTRLDSWPDLPNPHNYVLAAAELSACDPEKIHPARLFLLMETMCDILACPPFEGEHFTDYMRALSAIAQDHLRLFSEKGAHVIEVLEKNIVSHKNDSQHLFKALDTPVVESAMLMKFFNRVSGKSLYNFEIDSPDIPQPPQGSYAYVSSDVADILEFLRSLFAPAQGNFCDLGCGGGGVIVPFALLSNYRVSGIEIDRNWCTQLEDTLSRIGHNHVKVHCQDVLQADLSREDILYVYSPFEDLDLIAQLVKRIEIEAKKREIIVLSPFLPAMQDALMKSNHLQFVAVVGTGQLEFNNQMVGGIYIFRSAR